MVEKNNSWQNRYNQFKDIVKESILNKEKTTIAWKESLSRFIFSSRIRFLKFSIIFLVLYFVFFKSPLMWFLGDNLVYRDMPEKSDAIVVFTGYGYASYNNLGYQKRALDALNYYNKGYSDLIVVSAGREQTLSDAKLIKIYLSDQGIKEDKIIISSQYPTSTYENIKIISNYIDDLNINSILFITAPYHSLRSKLIWEKYKPDLIKIDAEGSELYILKGSIKTILKHKPDIFLSIHKKHFKLLGIQISEFLSFLKKINYNIKDSSGIFSNNLDSKEYYLYSK